ncbi:MAG: phage major capsid protein [Muribaculum sp.]|nr:phage major capsid protein [Muribaculum sp.]
MKLKEMLEAKKRELIGLKGKIEEGNADAIEQGKTLAKEIEDLEARVAAAEKAMDAIARLGKKEKDEPEGDGGSEGAPAKSLGDHFVKHMGSGSIKGSRFSVSAPEYKADPTVMTTPSSIGNALTVIDRNIVTAPRKELVIRDLFSAETISGNTLEYYVEGEMIGDFDVVKEGEQIPQIQFADPTKKVATLSKIPAFIKESDEYIEDAPFLASAINGRLLYQLGLKEQNWLVASLLATSGIQVDNYADNAKATDIAELILQAMADVQEESGFAADAIVINPTLYMKLRIGKDAEGRYYGGGYFGEQSLPSIWGLPAVRTSSVAGVIVGAFKPCGSVVSNGGIRVEATNSDKDDFQRNLMTIRAEERLGLAVRRPAGFKVLTKAQA